MRWTLKPDNENAISHPLRITVWGTNSQHHTGAWTQKAWTSHSCLTSGVQIVVRGMGREFIVIFMGHLLCRWGEALPWGQVLGLLWEAIAIADKPASTVQHRNTHCLLWVEAAASIHLGAGVHHVVLRVVHAHPLLSRYPIVVVPLRDTSTSTICGGMHGDLMCQEN